MKSNVQMVRELLHAEIANIQVGGLYRIKNDTELQEFGFLPRVNPACPRYVRLNQAPCTQRLYGDTGAMQVPGRWQNEIRAHNTPIGFKRLTNRATGWVNKPGWPKVEQLLFSTDTLNGWNRVEVIAINGGWATIRTQALTDAPLAYWWEKPELACHFTVIDITGEVFYPDPPGGPMVFPLLRRKNKPLKIELYKLASV